MSKDLSGESTKDLSDEEFLNFTEKFEKCY